MSFDCRCSTLPMRPVLVRIVRRNLRTAGDFAFMRRCALAFKRDGRFRHEGRLWFVTSITTTITPRTARLGVTLERQT